MQKLSGLFCLSPAHKDWTLSKLHVVVLLLGMVALWTVLCGVSHNAPDLDGMEELVWASSFEWGYFKHPPLPSWLMYGLTSVFGKPVWLTFFAGQLVSALALWFIWLLGCEFTTPKKALIAMLMVSTTMYFSIRGTIYNHNTVQLWSIAASTWLLYRALRYQKTASWVWFGIVCALAIMTKYSAVIQFAAFLLFILVQGHFREKATLKGICYALIAFLIVVSPHVVWLIKGSFASFSYAEDSIKPLSGYLQVLEKSFAFSYNQLGRLSPMLIVWLGLFYWNRKSKANLRVGDPATDAKAALVQVPYAYGLSKWDRSFLLWVGLTPFLATVLIFSALKAPLVTSWASTFFILYGFYAFWWLRGDEQTNLCRTVILVIAVHVLMAVGYALARGPIAYYAGRDARSTYPGAAIAAEMNKAWRSHVPNTPLTLVAADRWLGGNIAIHISPKTNVFINASYTESPWLDPDSALDCGVLIAYSPTTLDMPASALKKLFERASWHGVNTMPWSTDQSPTIVINWAIIPPGPKCGVLG